MAGSVFVITGGFGALGRALAGAVLSQGDRVALVDYAKTPLAEAPAPGEDVLHVAGVDLTSAQAAQGALDEVAARFGGVDVLVNVAGGFRWQTLEDGDPGAWAALYSMNVLTAANMSRAALGHLRRSRAGRIVNIGANAALKAAAGMGAYAASKAGVHALTQSLAEELKPSGVTVNAVLPSILDTPANRADMPDADVTAWVTPADVSEVILFLASPGAQAVTGALVPVTGKL